jgi:indole-3-acetate monooxygenase
MKDTVAAVRGGLATSLAELQGPIRAVRATSESERRIPDSLFAELAAAGLFRLLLPVELGGPGLSLLDYRDIVEMASALDPSVGWLVGNGGGMARAGGYLPRSAAEKIFSDKASFVVSATGATGTARRTKGGFMVSGRWPFGSGSHHGTYFAAVCEVEGDPPAHTVLAYMPREAITLHDTWHVSGLRGTGSCDFEARDLFVPADFVHDLDHSPTAEGLAYRLPPRSAFSWTVATVPLGIARGARDVFIEMTKGHKRFGTTVPIAEREVVQAELGRIETGLLAARCLMTATMERLCMEVASGTASETARLEFRTGCTFASETAVAAVGKYCELAGAAAIFENRLLERFDRDVRAAARHVAMSPGVYTIQGMAVLGLDVSETRF